MHTPHLNEESFIEHLMERFPSKDGILGIGDDCAVFLTESEKGWLITTDALVEGIHFLKEEISPKDLGYKAVAVSVSDVAAMGGEPKYAFLSLAFPKNTNREWAHLLIEGIKEACDKWGILLLGGDTVGSKRDIFLNLTLIGSAHRDHIKYRDQAQPGDLICVSGYLGNSGAGLKALQEKLIKTNEIESLIHSHFHPEPSPEQGKWLAEHHQVHSMMDLSDGLSSDLKKLLKKSKKGAVIEIQQLPISLVLSQVCKKENWDPLQFAIASGEDYCLLFTIGSEDFENIQYEFQKKFNSSFFCIGHITTIPQKIDYQKNGKTIQINYTSFDHF